MIDQRKKCHACGEDAKSICSGCRIVYFCSKECQVSAWPSHKRKCKAAKKEAKRQAKQQAQERQEAQAQAAAAMLQQQHRTVEFIPTTQDGTATVNAPPSAASAPMPPPSQAHDEFLQQNQQHSQESDESLFSSPLDELD